MRATTYRHQQRFRASVAPPATSRVVVARNPRSAPEHSAPWVDWLPVQTTTHTTCPGYFRPGHHATAQRIRSSRRSSVREIARPAEFRHAHPGRRIRPAAHAARLMPWARTRENDCVLGFHFGHSGGLPGYRLERAVHSGPQPGGVRVCQSHLIPRRAQCAKPPTSWHNSGQIPGARGRSPSPALLSRCYSVSRQVIYEAMPTSRASGSAGDELPPWISSAELRNTRDCRAQGEVRRMPASRRPHHHRKRAFRIVDFSCERGKLKIELILAPTRPGLDSEAANSCPRSPGTRGGSSVLEAIAELHQQLLVVAQLKLSRTSRSESSATPSWSKPPRPYTTYRYESGANS